MSKIRTKGTALKMEIGTVFTAIAQVISLDGPEADAQTTEVDTLDNATAGIPYMSTGRTEPGEISGELFFDPVLAGHRALTDLLTTPAEQHYKLVFADALSTEWPFTGAGLKGPGPKVALGDGLKASFSVKLADLVTYPI